MKKWLILFVVVDFIFVGLVLKVSTQNERRIASVTTDELTKGQQQKFDLVKSFQFTATNEQLVLQSDKLQMICDSSSLIEVKYSAMNVAYAGQQPTISHVFSCAHIKIDQSLNTLTTSIESFKSMHKNKQLSLNASVLTAAQVYSDEDFPTEWKVSEISITGTSTFIINQFEIDKAHTIDAFNFKIN